MVLDVSNMGSRQRVRSIYNIIKAWSEDWRLSSRGRWFLVNLMFSWIIKVTGRRPRGGSFLRSLSCVEIHLMIGRVKLSILFDGKDLNWNTKGIQNEMNLLKVIRWNQHLSESDLNVLIQHMIHNRRNHIRWTLGILFKHMDGHTLDRKTCRNKNVRLGKLNVIVRFRFHVQNYLDHPSLLILHVIREWQNQIHHDT